MKNLLLVSLCLIVVFFFGGCFYPFNRTSQDTIVTWNIEENKLVLFCRRNVDKILDPIANIQGHSLHHNVEDVYFSAVYDLDGKDAVIKPSEVKKVLTFDEPWGDTDFDAVKYSSLVLSSSGRAYKKNSVLFSVYERRSMAVVLEMYSDNKYFGRFSPDFRTAYCLKSGRLIRYDIPEKKSILLPDVSYNLVNKFWESSDNLSATSIKNIFYRRHGDKDKNSTAFLFYDIITGNLVQQVNLKDSYDYWLMDAAIRENGSYLFFIDEPYPQYGLSIFDQEGKKLKNITYKNEGLYSSPSKLIDVKNHRVFFTDDIHISLWKKNNNQGNVVVWDYEKDTVKRIRLYLDL